MLKECAQYIEKDEIIIWEGPRWISGLLETL